MTAVAVYSLKQLSTPFVAFCRLKVAKHKKRWYVPPTPETKEIESFKDFIKVIPCFFPDIAYNIIEPTDQIKELCNFVLPRSPQCKDGEEDCIEEHTPLGIKLPFYFSIWGASLGCVFRTSPLPHW
jgi:hypothetical protein